MEKFNPFEFQGRIGRLQYFGFAVIWALIFVAVSAVVGGGMDAGAGMGPGGGMAPGADMAPGTALLYLVLMVVFLVATVSYGVRRLHDFDKSGWWYLLAFVPFANLVMGLILLFAPGTPGANRYGVR